MARIRSIHPSLWTDEDFVVLSPFARLLYLGLLNEADDNGIFPWRPLQLKMRILPADNVEVSELLTEIEARGLVWRYPADDGDYGMLRNFQKYQSPRKPSFQHPLPESPLPQGFMLHPRASELDLFPHQCGTANGECGTATGNTGKSPSEGRGEEGRGRDPEGNRNGNGNGRGGDRGGVASATVVPPIPFDEIKSRWNEVAGRFGLPQVSSWGSQTSKRMDAIKARWKDPYWRDNWAEAIKRVPWQPWRLQGTKDRPNWKANIDYLLTEQAVRKLMEEVPPKDKTWSYSEGGEFK